MRRYVDDEKWCECGHRQSLHKGGRGMCSGATNGRVCSCSQFKTRTKAYERVEQSYGLLAQCVDMLERWPEDPTESPSDIAEREALIALCQRFYSGGSVLTK